MKSPTRITFLLMPSAHLLDFAGVAQAFQEGNRGEIAYVFEWCGYARDIQTSAGLGMAPLPSFEDIPPPSDGFLFVPGFDSSYALSGDFHANVALHNWLRRSYTAGAAICSVCAGAFVLGAAGLLDGKRCTTHWRLVDELKRTFPLARTEADALFTQDGALYTSAGISSGIDLALRILEDRHGALFAHHVARELVVYHRRSGRHTQSSVYLDYRNHIHPGVHKIQDWIIEHLQSAPTLETLASVAAMSVRHLTRVFRQTTGISINDYITLLRREKAQTLLNNPEYGLERIAEVCGFASVRQLRRILGGK